GDTELQLTAGQSLTIGSGPGNDVRIDHPTVSTQHCEVHAEAGGLRVDDLGSRLGTLIDDQPARNGIAAVGQTLRLGGVEITVAGVAGPPRLPSVSTHRYDVPLRARGEASFGDLMAEELRRAPWFALSVSIHAIVLLVLYLLADARPQGDRDELALRFNEQQGPAELDQPDRDETAVVVEEVTTAIELPDANITDRAEAEEDAASAAPSELGPSSLVAQANRWYSSTSGDLMTDVKGGGNDILREAGKGGSGGFRRTVSRMRESGLEIVFVFDSTGSMGSVLRATKERISRMAELLQILVPKSRIGLVTYRDEGMREDYVTRVVPLSLDPYRTVNFMQVIRAGGGGDRQEAVLAGLQSAFDQSWEPGARRVVVLVGDAPAHEYQERKIEQLTRSFTSNGRSFVHAIVTATHRDDLPTDTLRSFERIAKAGKGECLGFEDERVILRQVLSLAFGRQFRKNLDRAARLLEERRDRVETWALDLVRREDLEELDTKLGEEPISPELVKALLRSRSEAIALELVDRLASPKASEPVRQVAAHVLQHVLGLDAPPNDPFEGGRISTRNAAALRELVRLRL
ncbi:MAG: FHA domain-containing protein, partial [Planctomycetota bacterium]